MLNVYVFFASPLRACDMAQAVTYEHQRRVAVGEVLDYSGSVFDLMVDRFNDVACADSRPVLRWKVAISQRFFHAVIHELAYLSLDYFLIQGSIFSDMVPRLISECVV